MDCSPPSTCRACLGQVVCGGVSLLRPGVRSLYEECTYISLPDHCLDTRSQFICNECFQKCQDWYAFKTKCLEYERETGGNAVGELENRLLEPLDGSMEDIVLRIDDEDEEEDLLSLLRDKVPSTTSIKCENQHDETEDDLFAALAELHEGSEQEISETMEEGECAGDDEFHSHTELFEFFQRPKVVEKEGTEKYLQDPLFSRRLKQETERTEEFVVDNIEYWVCPICDANLLNSETYRDHLTGHLNEDSMKCKTKSKKFKIKFPKRSEGLIRQFTLNTFSCPICRQFFFTKGLLKEHLRFDHSLENNKMCSICLTRCLSSLRTEPKMLKHILQCHVDYFKCTLCFEEFGDLKLFTQHNQMHTQTEQKLGKFQACPLCDEACKLEGLRRHLMRKHRLIEECLCCPSCSATYQSVDTVLEHIMSVHNKWCCKECNKMLYSPVAYRQHINHHKQQRKQNYC